LIIDLLFEFPTLNGGERSMLSVLAQLTGRDGIVFRALCPYLGPLAEALAKLGVSVTPFAVRGPGDVGRSRQDLLAELTEYCADHRPTIVHANSLAMSRLLGQLDVSRLQQPPIRSGHLRDIIRLSGKAIRDLNQNDGLIAVSEATKRCHVDRGLNSDRCRVIYNGVDTLRFQPGPGAASRQELLPGISEDAVVILNVGQICLRKAQLFLAEWVCRTLKRRNDLHLVLAGERHSQKAESVEFEQAIEQTFADAGYRQHLHLLGYRSDVHQLMNASDLLVHVAHQEPFGRVLLEAAASGLPIIATDVGGTRELLQHQVDALLIRPDSQQDLTAAFEQLMSAPELQIRLADAARTKIEQHFTVVHAAEKLFSFWKSLIAEQGGSSGLSAVSR
jgi:glycosyltransferase involved in cell wall biosynthesis